jgi:DNA-binding MarR family transcriptional regulator
MGHDRDANMRVCIADTLNRGASLLVRHVARGASLTSRTVLATLDEDGPTRLTALAAATGVSQPAMTQFVGRMEREGQVIRLIDPEDARATLVDLTDGGRAVRAGLLESLHERLAQLLDTLSPHDEATLGLAMRVALPLIEQLIREAAQQQGSLPACTSSALDPKATTAANAKT